MKLHPIWGTKGDPHYEAVKADLIERFGSLSLAHITEGDYSKTTSYGRHNFYGTLKKDVEICELGLSMMADGGYSYFGGHSRIIEHPDGRRTFSVEIWFD